MEKTKPAPPVLGHGAYPLAEVARYASVRPSTAREWFKGRRDHRGRGPILVSDYQAVDGDYAVSFLDLIDTYVVGRFRDAGVKMSTVRQAYEVLRADLETTHPFAHSMLYTDGKRVIVGAAGKVADELLYDAISKQMLFSQLDAGLERIDYCPGTQLAARWRIAPGVLIDPQVSFGKPVIQGTGPKPRSSPDNIRRIGAMLLSWAICLGLAKLMSKMQYNLRRLLHDRSLRDISR